MNNNRMLNIVLILSASVMINFVMRLRLVVGHTSRYTEKRKLRASSNPFLNPFSPRSSDVLFRSNGSMWTKAASWKKKITSVTTAEIGISSTFPADVSVGSGLDNSTSFLFRSSDIGDFLFRICFILSTSPGR